MTRRHVLPIAASLLALAPLAATAQGVVTLVEHGAPLGNSTYVTAQDTEVDDAGATTVVARTPAGWKLLRNGAVVSQAGEPMPAGLPGSVVEFVRIEEAGRHVALEILSDHIVDGSGQVSILWNRDAVASEGGPVLVPGVPAGTSFQTVALAAANELGQLMLIATLDPGGVALLRYDVGDDGSVVGGAVLVRTGDSIGGSPVTGIDAGQHVALNAHGSWLAAVSLGASQVALVRDGAIVARTGDPSPVTGRTYGAFLEHHLNDGGQTLWLASLDDGSRILVRDGETFMTEGTSFPFLGVAERIAPPCFLANSGDVFWRASIASRWHLMRNEESPLVDALVDTLVGDRVIERVYQFINDVSDDGRYWLGDVVLGDGTRALVRATFGTVVPIEGCAGNPGTLGVITGRPVIGGVLSLRAGSAIPGATALVVFSRARAPGGPDCGVVTPYGELLIDLGQTIATRRRPAGSFVSLMVPPDPSIIGVSLFAQSAVIEPTTPPQVTMTNALELAFGAL
jgi:hypothetical protein